MRFRLLLPLLACVALLGACGGDDEPADQAAATTTTPVATVDTTPTTPTTPAEKPKRRKTAKKKAASQTEKEQAETLEETAKELEKLLPGRKEHQPYSKKDPVYKRFVRSMDKECRRYQREGADAAKDVTGDPEAQRGYYHDLADITDASVKRMKAFTAPSRDRKTVDAFIRRIASNVPLLRDIGDAIVAEDRDALQRLATKLARNSVVAAGIAQRYGFKVCGGGAASGTR